MKNFTYLFFCFTLLLSCKKKQQEPFTLSGNYVSTSTAVVTSTVMYTKFSSSSSWSDINHFLIGQGFTPRISDIKQKTLVNDVAKISLNANGSATVDFYAPYATNGRLVFSGRIEDSNPGDFVIRAPKADSALSPARISNVPIGRPIAPRSYYIDENGNIGDQDFDPGISSYPGQYTNVSTKKQLLIIKDNELYLPMLLYSFKRITESSIAKYISNDYTTYNLVNPNVQQILSEKDTLVAQQLLIKLIKQP